MHSAKWTVALAIYLTAGVALAGWSYSRDLRTFRCSDPGAPHGYVTIYVGDSYENPGPGVCRRYGFTGESIRNNGYMIVFGVPLVLARLSI